MATKHKHVKAIIQLRRAIESDWVRVDPVLRLGEPALSTDVYKLKIGDGTRKWSEIPYLLQNEFEQIISQLENLRVEDLVDGMDYATKEYVDERAGGVAAITVNGEPQIADEDRIVHLVLPVYTAGNGVTIVNDEIALDDLVMDCGTSTINV